MNIEATLRTIEDRAAMLQHLADNAATSGIPFERAALSGLGEVGADISRLALRARRSLDVRALGAELRRR